jgi:hypothetical protein
MANNPTSNRQDPIRENHYKPLERSELASTWIFYIAAVASFGPLLLDQRSSPKLYSAAIALFALLVVCNFILSIANRLYFFPRAEDARRKEFLSNTFRFNLIHERTTGYYNNSETDPLRRLGISALENLFFSKAILRRMAPAVRTKAALYFALWITAALWRDTPLDWLSTAAQVVFSEEIISRWLRLEWARNRAENIYASTHSLYQLNPPQDKLTAYAISAFADYESGKSLGGILLSKAIFEECNAQLTAEWEIVKAGLPLRTP